MATAKNYLTLLTMAMLTDSRVLGPGWWNEIQLSKAHQVSGCHVVKLLMLQAAAAAAALAEASSDTSESALAASRRLHSNAAADAPPAQQQTPPLPFSVVHLSRKVAGPKCPTLLG